MNSSLLFGSVFRSSRAWRSCGEAVAGAGGTRAHARASIVLALSLAKSLEHSGSGVDDHGVRDTAFCACCAWVCGVFFELRLPRAIPYAPIEGLHFSYSRWDQSLGERIVEHILWVSRPRTIVEEAELVPNGSLVHFAELFACHKRGVLIFEGCPVSS